MNKDELIEAVGVRNYNIINILHQAFCIQPISEAAEMITRGIWMREPFAPSKFQLTVLAHAKIMLINSFYKKFSIHDKIIEGYGLYGKPIYGYDDGVFLAVEGAENLSKDDNLGSVFNATSGQFIFFDKCDDFLEGGYVQGMTLENLEEIVYKVYTSGLEYEIMIMTR